MILLTLLTAAAMAVSPVLPSTASAESDAMRPAEVLVEAEPIILPHLLASAEVPETRCPAEAPVLLGEEYSKGDATGHVGRGVELRIKGGVGVDANISRFTRDGAGGAGGNLFDSVTNWTPGQKSVQLVLHCSSR